MTVVIKTVIHPISIMQFVIDTVHKVNEFGFMCEYNNPVSLFRPGKVLKCENLVQWACEAHSIVAASGFLITKAVA